MLISVHNKDGESKSPMNIAVEKNPKRFNLLISILSLEQESKIEAAMEHDVKLLKFQKYFFPAEGLTINFQ